MSQDLLKISEAAKRLGIAQATLRNYSDRGLIPVVKLPSGHRRFRPSDVDDLRRKIGLNDVPDEGRDQA